MGFFRRRSTTAAIDTRPLTPNSAHLSPHHHLQHLQHHQFPMFAHIPESAHNIHAYGPPPAYTPSPTMLVAYPPSSRHHHHHPASYGPVQLPVQGPGYPSPHRYVAVPQQQQQPPAKLQRAQSTRSYTAGGHAPSSVHSIPDPDDIDTGYEADRLQQDTKRGFMRSLVDYARGRSKSRSGRGNGAAGVNEHSRSRSRSHADYSGSGSEFDAKHRSSSSDRGRRDRRDRDRDRDSRGATGLNGFEKDMLRALDKAVRDDPVSKEDRYRNATMPMAIPPHRNSSGKEELRRKIEEEDRQARKYRDSTHNSQGYDSDYHQQSSQRSRHPERERDRDRYSGGGGGGGGPRHTSHHQRSLSRGSNNSSRQSEGISESPTLREHTAFNARQLGGVRGMPIHTQRPPLLHRGQTAPDGSHHHYHTDVPQSNKLVRRSTAPPPPSSLAPSSVAPGSPHVQPGSPAAAAAAAAAAGGAQPKAPTGWFNSRGDQLLDSMGNILRLPQHLEYPPHLKGYPAPGTGWQDHLGQIVGPDLKWRRKVG